ncbi:MAG: 4Fe-4S binding protein [Promethearchaeota archaeon]
MTESIDEKYKAVAGVINRAGGVGTQSQVSETAIKILKKIVAPEHLQFLLAFKEKASQTMEQLKESLVSAGLGDMTEEAITKKVDILARGGCMFNQPTSKGLMVFRVLPFWNVGIFEYVFMGGGELNDENKELAALFTKLSQESNESMQRNFDGIVANMDKFPAIDRTVPYRTNKEGEEISIVIDENVEVPQEWIIPVQEIDKIIEKFDDIAVAHCFCRYHEYLDGYTCKYIDPNFENCFTFGKSARHVSQNGFGRLVSKEEAKAIMKKSEDCGLVHKAYHPRFNITKDETSVCNCCSDCCGNSPIKGNHPIVNASMYIARVDVEKCIGCGTCEENCTAEAIFVNDNDKAEVNERCIGCGICAYNCPENAISLITKPRIVRIPPKRKN